MRGADGSAPVAERAGWALTAGCDFVLLCNDRGAVDAVLDGVRDAPDRDSAIRQVMAPDEAAPLRSSEWRIALADIDALRAA